MPPAGLIEAAAPKASERERLPVTAPLYHLGRFCARHNKLVLAAWVAAAVVLALLGSAAGHRTSNNLTLPGSGSTKATDVLQANLPAQANGTNPLVMEATHGQLTDQSDEQAIDQTVAALQKTPHVTKAVNPFGQGASNLVSKDGKTAYIPVTLNVSPSQITNSEAQAVLNAAGPARQAGLQVSLGGYAGQQLSKPSTGSSVAIGLAAAVVILLLAFGTATAMAMPIITAVLGLISTLSIISLLGQVAEVPTTSPTLATMIGLGVGIDYALFIVTRHRLQLRDGLEIEESIARATATAGGAVLFAGTTVVIALCSLWLAGIPLVTTLGYTAAISVAIAVLGATTLLPALLGALGPRINSLKVTLGRSHPDGHQPHGWKRWAQAVAKRPWRSLIASVAVLVLLAIPLLGLRLGQEDVGALPTSTTARQAYDALSNGFGPGSNGPLLIAAQLGSPAKPAAPGQSPATDPRLQSLSSAIQHAPDVKHVSPPTLDQSGNTAVYTVIADSAPSAQQTSQLVSYLRSTAIPAADQRHQRDRERRRADRRLRRSREPHLGEAADDDRRRRRAQLRRADARVAARWSCRSKAAVMNLLSVGAAYGVVTAVFQNGRAPRRSASTRGIPIVRLRPAADVRDPVRAFDGLRGVPAEPDPGALPGHRKAGPRGDRRARKHRPGHHLRRADHGLRVHQLRARRRPRRQGVRRRPGRRDRDRRDARPLPARPGRHTLLGKASWWMPSWLGRRLPRIRIEGEGYFTPQPAAPVRAAVHASPPKTPVTNHRSRRCSTPNPARVSPPWT